MILWALLQYEHLHLANMPDNASLNTAKTRWLQTFQEVRG